jgi:LacI family transcriptional regulator
MSGTRQNGPHGSRATIRDIARLAGVSVATVSRVLNDRPDVSPHTRDAVLRHIRAHNYTSNRSARALSVGRSGLIGLTVPMLQADYFASILSGASEALYEQEMRAVLCTTLHEHDREVSLIERLIDGATDGAIILLPEESGAELKALQAHGYPFVVADPRTPLDDGIPAVSAAHWAGAKAATDLLRRPAHPRSGLTTAPRAWAARADPLDGYRTALAGAGVLPEPGWVIDSDFKIDGGRTAAQQLLAIDPPLTAIFASNDNMAVGVLQAARQRGLQVPDDVSVVGFDDAESASIVTPALTTVRQPLAELGRIAVSLLMRLIDGQRVEALRIELATRLVVRESTAPPLLAQGGIRSRGIPPREDP